MTANCRLKTWMLIIGYYFRVVNLSSNLLTYQLTNLPTYQPTNLLTYKPTPQSSQFSLFTMFGGISPLKAVAMFSATTLDISSLASIVAEPR